MGGNDRVGEGAVRFKSFEGGFYAIDADDGQHYDPLGAELAPEFRQNGVRVRFRLRLRPADEQVSFHMYGSLVDVIALEKL